MQTWKRIPFYLAAITFLLAGAVAYDKVYQKFLRQHQDQPRTKVRSSEYCDALMHSRNPHRPCKPYHILIHASEAALRNVCGPGGYAYHSGKMRRSRSFYPITICRLAVVTRDHQCMYYTTFGRKRIVVRCSKTKLPMDLDEFLTLTP